MGPVKELVRSLLKTAMSGLLPPFALSISRCLLRYNVIGVLISWLLLPAGSCQGLHALIEACAIVIFDEYLLTTRLALRLLYALLI